MSRMVDGDPCECCGATCYEVSATLIRCRACNCFWGKCNGVWVWDPTDCRHNEREEDE